MQLNLPTDTVRFYNDGPECPNTPFRMEAERAYRDGFRCIAMSVPNWKRPPQDLRDGLKRYRKEIRRKAEVLVPSSVMYGNPSYDSEQIVYRARHEVAAASIRGSVQAFDQAEQIWDELNEHQVPYQEISRVVMKPWSEVVLAWSKAEINPNTIKPPPRPEKFIPQPSEATLEPLQAAEEVSPPVTTSPAMANAPPERPQALTRRMTDVEREQLAWLWPGRIPLGKLTLLAGDPGLGKSFVTLDIAARVSSGEPWPDMPLFPQSPAGVLLFNAEDDLGDTIAPRLDKAGADDRNIVVVEGVAFMGQRRHFSLELDLPRLVEVIEQNPGTRLVIIDPISAYTGKIDSHNNSEVRGLLAPLAEIASRFDLSIVAVTHLSKSGGAKAVYRAMGSLAFAAASRAVWAIVKDQDDSQRRLFLPAKLNLAQDPDGLAYRIVEGRVEWELDPVRMHADDAFAAEMRVSNGSGSRGSERREAAEWLRDELADGPKPASEIIEVGEQIGFAKRTLQRALKSLGGETEKQGGVGQGWLWSLPTDGQPEYPSPTTKVTDGPATRELSPLGMKSSQVLTP